MATKRKTLWPPNMVAFALCRSMGHEWHHQPPIGTDDAANMTDKPKTKFRVPFGGTTNMVGLPSMCFQCGTERMRWITRTGETRLRYMHPDGYEQHGDERLTSKEWRTMYVASIFDDFNTPNGKRHARQ